MRRQSAVDVTGVLHAVGAIGSEKAARSLASDAPRMVFLIADGKVVDANRKGEEALGIGREKAPSHGLEVFRRVAVAPEYLELGQESVLRRSRGEEVPPLHYALLTRDGRRIEGVLTSGIVERQGRRELLGIFTDTSPVGLRGRRAGPRSRGE